MISAQIAELQDRNRELAQSQLAQIRLKGDAKAQIAGLLEQAEAKLADALQAKHALEQQATAEPTCRVR